MLQSNVSKIKKCSGPVCGGLRHPPTQCLSTPEGRAGSSLFAASNSLPGYSDDIVPQLESLCSPCWPLALSCTVIHKCHKVLLEEGWRCRLVLTAWLKTLLSPCTRQACVADAEASRFGRLITGVPAGYESLGAAAALTNSKRSCKNKKDFRFIHTIVSPMIWLKLGALHMFNCNNSSCIQRVLRCCRRVKFIVPSCTKITGFLNATGCWVLKRNLHTVEESRSLSWEATCLAVPLQPDWV